MFCLSPLLVLDGPSGGLTPLTLLPTAIAEHSRRLMRLAAVPFHLFRFVGPEHSLGSTYPIDFWFTGLGGSVDTQRPLARPFVVWSTRETAADLVRASLTRTPFVLFISEDARILDGVRASCARDTGVEYVHVGNARQELAPDTVQKIWAGYLRMLRNGFNALGVPDSARWRAGLDDDSLTLDSWIALADEGYCSRSGKYWPRRPVPNDLVVAPSRVLRNLASFHLSDFLPSKEAEPPDQSSAADARRVCALRGLSNLCAWADQVSGISDPLLFEAAGTAFSIPEAWLAWVRNKASGTVGEFPPANFPEDALARVAPRQLILLCPATSDELHGVLETADWNQYNPELKEVISREREYFENLLRGMMKGGRVVPLPAPDNEDQQMLLDMVGYSSQSENQTLSALSVFYASRFGAPVLKLPRLGETFLSPFRRVNSILEAARTENRFLLAREDAVALSGATVALSDALTSGIPAETLATIEWLRESHRDLPLVSPIIHALSDYPLELARVGQDYLGYEAELSRTPITPGLIPFLNFQATEMTTELPTAADQLLLVTPFEDDELMDFGYGRKYSSAPDFARRVIRRRGDLFDALHDERVRCLVYFGHGLWDPEQGGALVLQDHLFTRRDLQQVHRIPPVIVLIGCNTAASGTVLGGFHATAFLRGAHLLVGTSFPVPRVIGATFLGLFLHNLLASGIKTSHGAYKYRDLSELVTVVRRRMRFMSDIYSLVEQGRLSPDESQGLMDAFVTQMNLWRKDEAADHRRQFRLLAELLAEAKVLSSPNKPLSQCGIVPYPLFFQTLGFTWTNRSAQWGT